MELPFLALARGDIAFDNSMRPNPDLEQHLSASPVLHVYYFRGSQFPCERVADALVPSAIGPINGVETALITSVAEIAHTAFDAARSAGWDWIYLGAQGGQEHIAIEWPEELPLPIESAPEGEFEFIDLRFLAHRLNGLDARVAVITVALKRWHEELRHCSRCGEAAAIIDGGWVISCPADESLHYPHIAPAVIMAITDADDRILLGHGAHMPPGLFSTVAGFIDAGEGAEDAVRREVLEETGIIVGHVEYFGSQPWPFPGSLMLGFTGRAQTTEISLLDQELAEARWFTRQEWRAAIADGHVRGPMPASIAFALISQWLADGENG